MTTDPASDLPLSVAADLVNVFLDPADAAALPVPVEIFYTSVKELDKVDPDQPFSPLLTARARIEVSPPYDSPDDAKRALAWLAEILAFATRRPAGVFAFTTTQGDGVEGPSWESAGPMRFARRKGAPKLYRTSADLATLVSRALERPPQDLESTGLEHAVVWHNLARREAGVQYLDVRLLHQWIPLELLAARWAMSEGRGSLLSDARAKRLGREIKKWGQAEALDATTLAELSAKSAELKRRPAISILLEFIRTKLSAYPAQPTGDELENLVKRSIRARNQAVHQGAVDFDQLDGSSSASRDLYKIAGITERVVLSMLEAPLPYLTELPWTLWRSPS